MLFCSHLATVRAYRSWGALFLFFHLCLSPKAHAQDDFGFDNSEWNGLTRLFEIAAVEDVPLQTHDRIDLEDLTQADSLLILHPQRLPIASCVRFLKAGGRIVLADDFGGGGELLSTYQLSRSAADLTKVPKLRNNPALAIAESVGAHPLNQGVSMLVTNHPTQITHDTLAPLFSFNGEGKPQSMVITGAVNEGRLVAVADPSVFINNMLEYRGNKRFAQNVLHYLHAGGRRITVINPQTKVTGLHGDATSDAQRNVSAMLERFSQAHVPAPALMAGSLLMLILILFLSGSSLPKSSPYQIAAMAPLRSAQALQMSALPDVGKDLSLPAQRYRIELRHALSRHLGVPLDLGEALNRLVAEGQLSSEQGAAAKQALFIESSNISPARLHQMVNTGEMIMKHLQGRR